ncbi:hypothetical protein SAMN05421682_10211 [Chryseobacterium indoltheticum]|uniref:Lipoprotein n=2 Tax=Chryseobacterium indoltheticum TaxID=254 RepID=A0A381FG04_9FLAO|nr:hypothetical protein SAMN05421682_10211 [Chryseobacterium indoltheticum]SUX45082.1 Uncharacterised protein [Chryseobacterium indoltheticum]
MNRLSAVLIILLSMGCNKSTLDLSTIDFSQPASEYLKDISPSKGEMQYGHWELIKNNSAEDDLELKLVGKEEVSKVYHITGPSDKSQFSFFGYPSIGMMGIEIVEYQNKIAFYSIYPEGSNTSEILLKLKQKLGEPSGVVLDTLAKTNILLQPILKTLPKDDIIYFTDEYDQQVSFPEHYIWKRNGMIYQFTLLQGSEVVSSNKLLIFGSSKTGSHELNL